jgi:anti-sigma factor RsiW
MKWFANSCRGHRQTIALHVCGALVESERIELEKHLADCARCRKYSDELKAMIQPLAGWKEGFANIEPREAAHLRWTRMVIEARRPIAMNHGGENPLTPALSLSGGEGEERKHSIALGNLFVGWWRELIWPQRRAWAGIAALWLVMWALNWGSPGTAGGKVSSGTAPMAAQTFEEERRMLAELFPPVEREPAEAPRRKPAPHSEWQKPWMIG